MLLSLRLESDKLVAAAEVQELEELLLKRETLVLQTPEVLLLPEQALRRLNSSTKILKAMTVTTLFVLLQRKLKLRGELTW